MIAKKKYGQNFLIDEDVLKKIDLLVDASNNDLIIEIGPGMGALTNFLVKKNAKLIAFEIDTDMFKYLNKYNNENTKIIYDDILNVELKSILNNYEYDRLFIVGNLPYYITTAIIKHIINEELDVYKMVFMMQDEVANRYTANINSKDYSSITLYLKYYFDLKKEFIVHNTSFRPIPKVTSAVVSFTKRLDILNVDKNKYFELIDKSFKQKRKTLKNNLKEYNFDVIKEVLLKSGLKEDARAEEINEDVFVQISKRI